MIDTHTHLYMDEFEENGRKAVADAVRAGVSTMILPNVDRESVVPLIKLHELCNSNTLIAPGLHPTEVGEDWEEELKEIFDLFGDRKVVGVGETGIDLHWDGDNIELQRQAFARQLELASQKNLPVIIHSRDALDETLRIATDFRYSVPAMVFHSFTGTPEDAATIVRELPEAVFGINGVVTFKNAEPLRQAVSKIGLDRVVLETDAPFLAPVPYRGKRNESAFIPVILHKLAELFGETPEKCEKITDDNAGRVFRLSPPSDS